MPAYVPGTNKRIGSTGTTSDASAKKKTRVSDSQAISKIVRAQVEKAIVKMAEVKHLGRKFVFDPYVITNTISVLMTDNYLSPMPGSAVNSLTANTGTAADQIIGNRIRVHKCTIDLAITPNNYDANTNPTPAPYIVKFWLYKNRWTPNSAPDWDTFGDPVSSNWFQVGAQLEPMSGAAEDLLRPVNKENFIVYKTFEMKVGPSELMGTGGNAGANFYTNNDYQYTARRRIDITRYLPKVIHFDNNFGGMTSQPIYLVWQCVRANGTTAGAGVRSVNIYSYVDLQYTDM